MEFGENGAVIRGNEGDTNTYSEHQTEHGYEDGPRSALGLFEAMRLALVLYICAEVVLISSLGLALFSPSILPSSILTVSLPEDIYGSLIGAAYFFFTIIPAFFVIRFTYRAMRNLHTIQSPAVKTSPFWSVGYYFIPIANFFMPANAMSQIYHGTHEAVGEKSRHKSPIGFWWMPFVLADVPEAIADYTGLSGAGAYILYAMSSLFGVIAALMLIRIGLRIAVCQERFERGGIATVFD